MSDERKKRSHWLIAILPALAVLVTYLGAYYGTTQEVRLQDGTNRVVGVYYVHNVGGRRLPWWANVSFGPRTGSINTSTDASGDKLPCQSAKPGFNRRHYALPVQSRHKQSAPMTDKPGWGLIWRGLKPQLIMLAVLGCLIVFLILLTMAGWFPTQSARE